MNTIKLFPNHARICKGVMNTKQNGSAHGDAMGTRSTMKSLNNSAILQIGGQINIILIGDHFISPVGLISGKLNYNTNL